MINGTSSRAVLPGVHLKRGPDGAEQGQAIPTERSETEFVESTDGDETTDETPRDLPAAHEAAAAILEEARAQARFEAFRIRQQAMAEAEQAKATMLEQARDQAEEEIERARAEAIAEAGRTKAALLEQCREQAFYEGARLRDEASVEAQQVLSDTERAARALTDQARVDAHRIREQAISEAERVKVAILDHARELSGSEAIRIREEALLEAEEMKASIIERARKDAEDVRVQVEQDKLAILEAAQDKAVRLHLEAAAHAGPVPADDSETKLLRASDVGSREFPAARRGFDPGSVRKWLQLVETSYSMLEEELERARREWQRALEILEMTRRQLGTLDAGDGANHTALEQQLGSVRAAWKDSIEALSARTPYQHDYDLPSLLVRASQLETRLEKRLYGYSTPQVQHLLEALTTDIARLEHQAGVLRLENDELRARMLAQLFKPGPRHLVIRELAPGVDRRTSPWGAVSSNGSTPSHETDSLA